MNAYLDSISKIGLGQQALSPLSMFLAADTVVKVIMAGLILASIWSWAIIIERSVNLALLQRRSKIFEREFRAMDTYMILEGTAHGSDLPIGRVLATAVAEWLSSSQSPMFDRETRQHRLVVAMDDAVANEIDALSGRLGVLATVGSVAPFVGLFGTVWGIMRSFIAIAETQNTTLAVVAPGIAEALFATAVGLFAAIPAVIGYNHLSGSIGKVEARLSSAAVYFAGVLARHVDTTVGR